MKVRFVCLKIPHLKISFQNAGNSTMPLCFGLRNIMQIFYGYNFQVTFVPFIMNECIEFIMHTCFGLNMSNSAYQNLPFHIYKNILEQKIDEVCFGRTKTCL